MHSDVEARRSPRWSAPASFSSIFQFRKFYLLVVIANVTLAFSNLKGAEAFTNVSPYIATADGRTCVENFDENVDYFENNKITDAEVTGIFTIEYHNFFKIVRQTDYFGGIETYVLYLCGTREPTAQELSQISGNVTTMVQIPPASYGVGSSSDIGFFQQLGALDTMVFQPSKFLTPKCIEGKHYEGSIGCFTTACVEEEWNGMGDCAPEFYFGGFGQNTITGPNNAGHAATYAYLQDTKLGQFNYIKFISTFLNRESIAQQVVQEMTATLNCYQSEHTSTGKNVLILTNYDDQTKTYSIAKTGLYQENIIETIFGENLVLETDLAVSNPATKEDIIAGVSSENQDIDVIILQLPAAAEQAFSNGPDFEDTDFTELIAGITTAQGSAPVVYDSIDNDLFFFYGNAFPDILVHDFGVMAGNDDATDRVTGSVSNNGMFLFQRYPLGSNAPGVGNALMEETCSCDGNAADTTTIFATSGTCAQTSLNALKANYNTAASCDASQNLDFLQACGLATGSGSKEQASVMMTLVAAILAFMAIN